jgi:hypothetical protein
MPSETPFEELKFCAIVPGTRVMLAPGIAASLQRRAPAEADFIWTLDSASADAFATAIEDLARPNTLAGSELLGSEAPGQIPIKVSRGEYTEDFLTPV